jgi:hypothetical protein
MEFKLQMKQQYIHKEMLETPIFSCVPERWLEVNMHPEGSAIDDLITAFLDFPLPSRE